MKMEYSEIRINGLPLPQFLQPREVPRLEFKLTMRMDPEAWQTLQRVTEPIRAAKRLEAARLYALECAEEAQRLEGFHVVRRDPRALLRAQLTLGIVTICP